MSAPYEIIVAPFELWWAPTGEDFPDVDETPAGNWAKVGTNGNLNHSDDGVTVTHEQNIETYIPNGATGPIKASRTEERLALNLTLWDITLEQYTLALNGNTVTEVTAGAGTPGYKWIGMSRNSDVQLIALLLKGVSPYDDSMSMQYQIPFAYHMGSPEVAYQKGVPAGLSLEFGVLVDPNAATTVERFGRIVAQNADAQ